MATPIPENRASFRLSEVARLTGGELVGEDAVAGSVVTDSRAIRGGELFVALAGERFDGHAHARAALDAGARAVLVERDEPALGGRPRVVVRDTLSALGALGAAHRARWAGQVVGITGSAGKTGTKEAVAAALRGAGHRVLATRGNLNNRVGVPMTLLSITDEDVAVIEMGTSEPGEIEALASIASPDVSVVTLVDAAHTEGLGDLEAVAREKGAIFRALGEEGVAIGGLDEPRVGALLAATGARTLSFGHADPATLRVGEVRIDEAGTHVDFHIGSRTLHVDLRLLGAPAVSQAAIAILVVEALGGDRDGAVEALSGLEPVPGRLVPRVSSSGLLVIDDAYNANPRSMRAALDLALELARARGGRALGVLGEMRELGAVSDAAHEEAVSREGLLVRAVGEGFERALAARGESDRAHGSPEEAARAALAEAGPRDVVVVKGSRAMAMERAIPVLLGEDGEGR